MWAFIYSIVIANVVKLSNRFAPGINFCAREFLRGVVAALGIVTSALIWFQVGVGVLNALVIVFFSYFFGLWLGRKVGLDDTLASLIGIGTSICGASAIAAAGPAIKAKEEEMGLAVACITLFGLLAMFLYPFLYVNTVVGDWFQHNLNLYAIWCGSGVHEVAQVAAAAGALGVEGCALLVKSIRVFMIGPMILLATYMMSKRVSVANSKSTSSEKPKITLPAYGVVFIVLSICCAFLDAYAPQIAALGFDWPPVKAVLSGVVFKFLLAVCFAGVGLMVKFQQIAKLGAKPFVVGAFMAILAGFLALILAIAVAPLVPPLI
jgi:uncharacterized integral membrane protein (TIGR00698 family)